jgi:outer membrane lipoprotein-sorting protein
MKKFIITIFSSILLTLNIIAQTDQKAVSILDKFSSTASSAPSVSMKFILVNVNLAENSTDTLTGSIILSKDSYRLDLPDNIIWFNGATSWSYLPAEQEVTITKPDKKDNSFQSRPSSIFTMYKKGFKSRLIEEKQDSYIIDLYPEDIKNELIRVRLTIAKSSMNLKTLEYKRRDGVTLTLMVRDYDLKQVAEPGIFSFNPKKYRDAEIIDMR